VKDCKIGDDEACSHGQCRKTWRVMMLQSGRQLPLCIEHTEQLLELRKHDKGKEIGKGTAANKFAARCHRVKSLEV
jgi:hypothetical protein